MAYVNNIRDKSYLFAKLAIELYIEQSKDPMLRPLVLQFVRSGTSIGANVEEAIAAESAADYRHKMSIAHKEAREAAYWLRLFSDTTVIPSEKCYVVHEKAHELVKILYAICQKTKIRRSDN